MSDIYALIKSVCPIRIGGSGSHSNTVGVKLQVIIIHSFVIFTCLLLS